MQVLKSQAEIPAAEPDSSELHSRQETMERLVMARQELEQALRLTALAAVIPHAVRNELSVMRDDLDRIIRGLNKTV